MRRRVVVTGIGAVSPCGATTESTWESIVQGRSGIDTIQRFDASSFASQIAGEVLDFDPLDYFEKKRVREAERFTHFAIAASQMALDYAGFKPTDDQKERVATIVGVGMCGLELLQQQVLTMEQRGPRRMSPYFIPAAIANMTSGQVSMRWGFRGPSFTTTSACASGAHSIGEAARKIERGDVDAALAGGAEASVCGTGVGGFCAMRALSKRNHAPAEASRPFDKGRDGFVIAEGAGMMLLEERGHALQRGAPVLAELVGYGATADAYHLTQPAPEGEGAQRAMRVALTDARLRPEQIDYVNAHATSTLMGDAKELEALRGVFGTHVERGLSISSTKSMHGHLLGAAGGLEAVLTVLAIRDQLCPPTLNLVDPEEAAVGFDLVPNVSKKKPIHAAISNSFGFGGTNVTLAFERPDLSQTTPNDAS
ncbi:MAG: beta-ketoacyl-ACP synthase II [Myxococcota bacterium]